MRERIALGFGNNIDYEVAWNSEIFEDAIRRYGIHAQELSTDVAVDSERNLVVSILSFLKSGSGGERFVSSPEIIEQFAQHFAIKVTLGGTSVRAAIAMQKLGVTAALHLVTINDDVRRLVPSGDPYVCSNTQVSSYPHLIIQFDQGARVKANDIEICAGRANRLIYVHDLDNSLMNLKEDFADLISDASILLISGFNAMQSRELLAGRLETLLKIMVSLPKDALVYFEDACFHNPGLIKLIHARLAGRIHIYGLNEDELQTYLDRELDLLNALQIKEALVEVRKIIPSPLIVVHSRYWALAYGENAQRVSKALKGGITMATTRFRIGDDFTVEDYAETAALPPDEGGVVFAGALQKLLGDKICCVPCVHIEGSHATTVGLGDAFVGGFLPALLP
jgi:ADP-dependent phosphofructokinase/glucokinase